MKRNISRAVVSVLLVLCLLGTLTLGGCSGFLGARVEHNGSDPYQTPELCGVWGAKGINEKLSAYFEEIIALIKQANTNEENELLAKMRYSLEKGEEGLLLHSWLEGAEGQCVALEDINVISGECLLPDSIPECISDASTLKSAMTAEKSGVDVNIYAMNKNPTVQDMVDALIKWYEKSTGEVIDFSKVERTDITDECCLKMLAVAPDYKYADKMTGDTTATTVMLVDTLAQLMRERNFKCYGIGSDSVTLRDLVSYADLYLKMYAPVSELKTAEDDGSLDNTIDETADQNKTQAEDDDADMAKTPESWFATVEQVDVRTSINNDTYEKDTAITRLELAENMINILKAGYFMNHLTDTRTFSDCTNSSAGYAVAYGLMDCFPVNSTRFTPSYKVRCYELPALTANLTDMCYNGWNASGSLHFCDWLTYSGLYSALVSVNDFYSYSGFEAVEDKDKELVNNAGTTDWYAERYGTGEYTDNNTITAGTAMLLNWNGAGNNTSVEDLRTKYLEKSTGEWTDGTVVKVLSDFGVNYYLTENKSTDDLLNAMHEGTVMLDDLRAGNIILARYSDTASALPQCMVIYGFERVGTSVRFFAHDPAASSKPLADGTSAGNSMIVESDYAAWAISKANGNWLIAYAPGSGTPASVQTEQSASDLQ